ncbi:MAG: hypothetical protein ACC645_07200, partial [Pirellulales bacterium]
MIRETTPAVLLAATVLGWHGLPIGHGELVSVCFAAAASKEDRVRSTAALPDQPQFQPRTHIDLYNPSDWRGPVVVELPSGRIAAPGLIDWGSVRLLREGEEIPFSIREGRPHWQAQLVAPIANPRAEDLLVFSVPVAPHTWVRVDVVAGEARAGSALARESGRLLIRYADLKVTLDETTGMLLQIAAADRDILEEPFASTFHAAEDRRQAAKTSRYLPHVQLVSSSSTPALTELNFVLATPSGLNCSLTYRIHAAGVVEIWFDERPWQGTSPWLVHSATHCLKIQGKREPLSYLINRAPYYGFADYEKVVKTPATVYRFAAGAVVELGEELANGRRWNRRLYIVPPDRLERLSALVELVDEGLVVRVEPQRMAWPTEAVTIHCKERLRAPAGKLAKAFGAAGLEATIRE